jgi:predicted small secreted protein
MKPEPLEFVMKKFYILLILLGTIVSVSGCRSTIEGAGEDIGNAADAVEDATN